MKKMKWAVLFAALVTMIGFTSCLSSEEGETYDLYEYVTVSSGYMGMTSLIGDQTGYYYTPNSEDVLAALKQKDGNYYPRALVALQVVEDIVANKNNYTITGIQVYNYVAWREATTNSDTLATKGDYDFTSLSNSWVKSGYLNIPFNVMVPSSPLLEDFNLYITGDSNDTLYTKLHYSKDNTKAMNSMSEIISFRMPEYDDNYDALYGNDSIVVTVKAKGKNGELKSSSKCTLRDLMDY